jgi:hypothetical protein
MSNTYRDNRHEIDLCIEIVGDKDAYADSRHAGYLMEITSMK